MGTNFYAIEKISKNKRTKLIGLAYNMLDDFENNENITQAWEEYQESITEELPKPIHLGKRSAGWQFLWDYPAIYNGMFKTHFWEMNNEYEINLNTIKEFLKDKIIFDEYENEYTLDSFLEEIKNVLYKTDDLDDGMNGEYSTQYFIHNGLRFSRFTGFN